ncbi:AMP-binding protein [Labrys sp. LIt4]|uniref:class I adenylate-forming enzyme family protein n=1 Tax=Labrys sp. LIt4 TaxID=2821355 RepID=UPI001AE0843C|nr:AMP-binding protein [Labrys sp. LIt4]MBP0580520.1 AMP-binding protein [Labrys sp. LIt4]
MRPIDYVLRSAQRFPDKVALEGPEGTLTYAELISKSEACAAFIQDLVPDERGRVGILAANNFAHVVTLLGILLSGRIWVPLNTRSAQAEIARAVRFVTPSLIVADASYVGLVPPTEGLEIVLGAPGQEPDPKLRRLTDELQAYAGKKPKPIYHPLAETQAIKFTGGTTGAPKGVMQSYRGWNAGIVSFIHAMRLQEDERFLATASISHGTSAFLFPILAQGGTIVLPEANRPPDLVRILERDRITATFLPPTLIYSILEEPTVRGRDWSALRHLIYGAAPMREDKVAEAQQVFGPVLETAYGQTESPAIIAFLTAAEAMKPENRPTVGRPTILTSVAILDSQGNEVAPGEWGEICVRGDLVMTGYWNQPEKTAEAFIKGWLRTGDGGYLDERGYLRLVDRIRDVIITGGFNVYPADVETAIGQHPDVIDCAVVGIPDSHWGEAVHGAVQLRAGSTLSERELIAFVRGILDGVKTPKGVHFFDELPRTANAKVSKAEVRREIDRRLGEVAA